MRRPMFRAAGDGAAGEAVGNGFHVFVLAATNEAAKLFRRKRQVRIVSERMPQTRLPEKPPNQIRQPPHATTLAPATNRSNCRLFPILAEDRKRRNRTINRFVFPPINAALR